MEEKKQNQISRRAFVQAAGMGAIGASAIWGFANLVTSDERKIIQGFDDSGAIELDAWKGWQPISERRIRVGIAGHGICKFGLAFSFQFHPNVEVVAVTDLIPERCEKMAEACQCKKTYPSCEEMIKDKSIEAIFVATDAPSHSRLCIAALEAGKHVACAVPAVHGSLEEAEKLLSAVKNSGKNYMMFETSYFHADLHAWRQQYNAGELGKLIYSEGEYFHYAAKPIGSYKGWRHGMPPQWYPTHSNAYYIGVTGGSFTEVSCMGMPSTFERLQPLNNRYKNPF
ncbi:MAG: Gfo/Idh/MocA family oxidoreductase, partial [Proteobacteria bacterium]|nr:Gfo/Idh/MocA family oxidoreductase [Pseudomonadota bacterium]